MKKRYLPVLLSLMILSLVAGSCGPKKQTLAAKQPLSPLELGKQNFEARDYAAAKTQFETVLSADSLNHEAVYFLGRIALQNGEIDDAVNYFEKSVSMDETNSPYHFWLGVGYAQKVQKGAFQLAPRLKEEFEKAVELDGSNLEARMGLAQFYMNAPPFAGGSQAKADEQVAAIIEQDPVKGHLFQAQIQTAKKDFEAAEKSYQAAAEADPKDPDIYFQMGMMYQAAKNYPAAFDALEKTLTLDPDYMNGLYQIGRTAIFAEDNLERGAECLERYVKLTPGPGNPSLAHAHWRLGIIYEKMGKKDMARKEYETALGLKPDLKEAQEALEKL